MCFSFSRIQAARCSVFAPKWTPIAGSLTSPAQNVPPSHTSPAQHPHIPPQKMHSSGLANPTLTEIHVALKRVLFLHDVQHTWPGSPPPRPFPALRLAIEIFQVCSALLVSSRARAPKTRPAAAADEKKTDKIGCSGLMTWGRNDFTSSLFSFGGPDLHSWREYIRSLRIRRSQLNYLLLFIVYTWTFHIHKWRTIQGIWNPL